MDIMNEEARIFMLYFLFAVMVVMSVAMFLMYLQLMELQRILYDNQQVLLKNKNLIGNLSEDVIQR